MRGGVILVEYLNTNNIVWADEAVRRVPIAGVDNIDCMLFKMLLIAVCKLRGRCIVLVCLV